ncbi:uncharacterized protein BJ171DRAFT_623263 [Polychytrium aggregatum]|uniref:uncharacterized protein n=1 Tax=Polychytrium aggregatum TaxID=110093 RepID=UPI0022FDB0F3|nr:uncharacterized protein BJ171DRAFT_623263 [Polychytrium aggregatum]KAI9203710.1 hypothetical protein BJ171DRAFT_623263 [Polychytrium aggregatum]
MSGKERRLAQRRILAEDPEWNLSPVPKLSDLCIKAIVTNFEKRPIINGIPSKHRERVLSSISTELPLTIVTPLIPEQLYWKRRAVANFKNCDPKQHGGSWKQLFCELHLQTIIESYSPKKGRGSDEWDVFLATVRLLSPCINKLVIKQLRPTEPAEGTVVKATDPPPDHLDLQTMVSSLPQLRDLSIYYGIRDCNIDFNWSFFGMTLNDCVLLTNVLKANNTLTSLRIQSSSVDDDRCRLISNALLTNKALKTLDLSHNKIGDSGARALAKVLSVQTTVLADLNLSNNKVGRQGAYCLGKALATNKTLQHLRLRMNYIGDTGGAQLCGELRKNDTLVSVDLCGNNLGAETVRALCALLEKNGRQLASLDLSCNKLGLFPSATTIFAASAAPAVASAAAAGTSAPGNFGDDAKKEVDTAGKALFEAISQNKYVTFFDIRVTDLSQEYSVAIQGIIAENMQAL